MSPAVAADDLDAQARRLHDGGVRTIGVVTWRDLDDPGAGGSELHINHLARLWAEAGLETTIFTGKPRGASASLIRDGVRINRRGGPLAALFSGPARTRHHAPDAVVETWHGFNFLAPLWAGNRPRIGIAHHVHQEQFSHLLPEPAARAAAAVERHAYPRFYRRTPLVTLSNTTKLQLSELGYHPDQITVAEPGVEARFTPGTKSETPLVVAVSRVMPQKRVDLLIDALVTAKQDHGGLQAVIAGTGPDLESIRRLASEKAPGGWLTVPGRVADDEQVRLYQQAWAVMSASASEGWGMSLSEAAACATPAVATDIAGHRDIVSHGETGLLVNADAASLAAAISRIASDSGAAGEMGRAAAKRVAAFSWERCSARTLSAIPTVQRG